MNCQRLTLLLIFYSLTSAFAQTPKLILPVGHTSSIEYSEYSRDGSKIVTASYDRTVKVWDAHTGLLLSNFTGHTDLVSEAHFSPDGKYLLTSSWDKTARVWDLASGKLLFTLKGHTEMLIAARYSPAYPEDPSGGSRIVTCSRDKTAIIWDAATGKMLYKLTGHKSQVNDIDISADGRFLATASWDRKVMLWDMKTGKMLRKFKAHTFVINTIRFSPNGKLLVTASSDHSAKLWDARTGKLIYTFSDTSEINTAVFSPATKLDTAGGQYIAIASNSHVAKIYDTYSGKIVFVLSGHTERVNTVDFRADGKYLVTASTDGSVKIWDVNSGKTIKNLYAQHEAAVRAFYSPACPDDTIGGKFISCVQGNNSMNIWDAGKGLLLHNLSGRCKLFASEYSHDGSKIITYGTANPNVIDLNVLDSPGLKKKEINPSFIIWDAVTGKPMLDFKYRIAEAKKLNYSNDGKKLLFITADSLLVWNNANQGFMPDLRLHFSDLNDAVFSPDGKKILLLFSNEARMIDAETGNVLFNFEGENFDGEYAFNKAGDRLLIREDNLVRLWNAVTGKKLPDLAGHSDHISAAAFSPDGSKIVTSSWDKSIKVWNAIDGSFLLLLGTHTEWVTDMNFNSDGTKIITCSSDATVKIWDVKNGVVNTINETEWVDKALFSPDGKKILTITFTGIARIWDAETFTMIARLEALNEVFISAAFSKDGKNIMIASLDNMCRIWNVATGKLLYTFFPVDQRDYLVFDDQYHYDGTAEARKLIYLTCNAKEVVALDQVKDLLWVPDLAERILKGDSINSKTLEQLDICDFTPEIQDSTSRPDEYFYKIKPRRGGLGETALLVNGIEVKRYQPNEMTKVNSVYELRIKKSELQNYFIAGQQNQVTVKAFTSNNMVASRGAELLEEAKTETVTTPPNLYAVMIGVSDYKGTQLDLKYAAKDATDISKAIGNAARKLLNTDGKEHVFTYNITTEKSHDYLPEKNSIKNVIQEIGKKSSANDILIIFFAGHGVMEGEKKQFYFLTSEASGFTDVSEVGISTAELTEWIKPENMKAQKRVLIFDACNSGQAIRDFVKVGESNQQYLAARSDDKSQQIKAIDKLNEKSGMFILSASASNQSAYEMGRYAQGLLTYALLKAIKQQPDILENGKYLNVSRWFDAAEKTVTEVSRESGARQEPQIVSNTNFNVGLVDQSVIDSIRLPHEKPLFAASNFQNSDENIADDDLELSKLLNFQLSDLSSRGADSKIVYVTSTTASDAYSLSGRYIVKGNQVTVNVNLKQNKTIKQKFEVTGNKAQLNDLVRDIAEKALSYSK